MQKLHRSYTLIGIFIVICGFVFLWGWTPADFSNPACKFKQNAAWISVDWSSKPVDENAVRKLAVSINTRDMRYLFPYATYLKPDGSFSLSYDYAKEFVSTFRKFDKNTRLLVWIGLPLANDRMIGVQGWVNLSNQNTRQQIVQFIGDLIEKSNFDSLPNKCCYSSVKRPSSTAL